MNTIRPATCRTRAFRRLAAGAFILLLVFHEAAAAGNAVGHRFQVQRQDHAWWLVKSNGERFFSLGVCCVNQGVGAKEWDPANPGYAAWRIYPSSNEWAAATLGRLKAWGFTTIGGWSDFDALRGRPGSDFAFAPVLHIGATAGAPWWDMWDPKIVDRLDLVARDSILPLRDDPRVIGYYTDNEIGWWNAILVKMTFEQAPASGQRQRLIQLLRQTYQNDWPALLRDFEPAPILESWEQLERHGVLYLRPGGNGIRVERRFLALLAERYYSLVHDAVRKYDPGALILGDRYPSFYYLEVLRASVPYVDVVSCNLNPLWADGSFPRYQVETISTLTKKPLIIGEFYMAARENGSGNKNNHGTYPVVATQIERAAGFRTTLLSLLRIPSIVGADWFQYYDQPRHGRFDGENFNFGLVDIFDRPYQPLTAVPSSVDLIATRSQPVRARPDASQGVPPAPHDPLGHFEPTFALMHWDREGGFVRPVSESPLADLYVCWSPQSLYLGLCAQDVVEDVFYRGKTVFSSERGEWRISIGSTGRSISGRIGAGMEPVFDEPTVRSSNISGLNGNTRNIAALEIPARLLVRERFHQGDTIEFSSTFFTHGRAYHTEWKGRFTLGHH